MLPPSLHRVLAAEAARAPSVHNIQPARWRFDGGRVLLFRALDRTLPVADPSGHDVRVSLGAAFEGMAIALSRHGYALGAPVARGGEGADGCELVAAAAIDPGAEADPLAPHVAGRRAWRGRFAPTSAGAAAGLDSLGDVVVVRERAAIAGIARMVDEASLGFARRRAYAAELYCWMRFSRAHPDWDRDGLNADCMALTTLERRAAAVLLRPAVFSALARLGAGKAIVSEARQTRSAGAVVLFVPPASASDFDVGRRFYRLWLEVTALGLVLVPMSALADAAEHNAALRERFGVAADRRIANVLRVGVAPSEPARSPRLPVPELLV